MCVLTDETAKVNKAEAGTSKKAKVAAVQQVKAQQSEKLKFEIH